ncbi:hypothetical protein ACWIUD_05045 [Helicobacter sp. 23-1044]
MDCFGTSCLAMTKWEWILRLRIRFCKIRKISQWRRVMRILRFALISQNLHAESNAKITHPLNPPPQGRGKNRRILRKGGGTK